ncbi:MAG: phosphopantetheine-binding protein [Clostridia bacterium]|nr:phosphopantetheine-binding protein [Clostridia bacterium]
MTIQEKLSLLEELLDTEKDTLSEETELNQLSQWDSIAVISLIAMFDETFGKVVTPKEVKSFKIIKDITDKME